MPQCDGYGSNCPDASDKEHAPNARPYCDACLAPGKPNACILVCNATAGVTDFERAECPVGATCKPLSLDDDPCDSGARWPAGAHPCQATGTCGLCTFP